MQAPPGVPTTLYVVGKVDGMTASGITGAEFRIEFQNPNGYLLSYTAPDGAVVLGNPLQNGLNIAFPSCQVPTAGNVSLGTVFVFNTGTGSATDIVLKRRNPPTNQNYPCALFTRCDGALFSKSCMTAPGDSSCLIQTARSLPTVQSDEFSTSLDGGIPHANTRYLGYAYPASDQGASCGTFEGASASILHRLMTVASQNGAAAAWVGLQNGTARQILVTSRWIQAGYTKRSGQSAEAYVEYVRHSTTIINSVPDGYSGILEQSEVPYGLAWEYSVMKDSADKASFQVGPIPLTNVFPWDELLESGPLATAGWTGEVYTDGVDFMPGTVTEKCKFSNVRYRKPNSTVNHTPSLTISATPETSYGSKSGGTGEFEIWRVEP